jgi:hypothetical protein
MAKNPYLTPGRLSDVIAAITALGAYRYYKLTFQGCAERIANRPEEAERWGKVLCEHPEFFRVSHEGKLASLVWRRQDPKRFDARRSTEITREEYDALTDEQKLNVSRRPLDASEITSLISIAVNLHERALEHQKERRWWVPIVTSGLAFLGALIGSSIGEQFLRPFIL